MRKPRVILFDDDVIILNMLELFFKRKGYEVFQFSSPVVCPLKYPADSCKNLAPCADVIISDYKMPQMTGQELFQHQSDRGCRIDCKMKAIMTGYLDEEIVKRCKDSGYKFFNKPFNLSVLSGWLSVCEQHFDLSQELNEITLNKLDDFKEDVEYCTDPAVSQ